jgi:hypothetical protein
VAFRLIASSESRRALSGIDLGNLTRYREAGSGSCGKPHILRRYFRSLKSWHSLGLILLFLCGCILEGPMVVRQNSSSEQRSPARCILYISLKCTPLQIAVEWIGLIAIAI